MVIQILIVAILFIGLQVNAIPQSDHHGPLPAFVIECAEKSGIKPPDMGADKHSPPEITPEWLCFIKCAGEGAGIFKDGKVDLDKLNEFPIPLPPERMEGVKKCIGMVTKVEVCEDMSEMAKCVRESHM